MQSLKLASKTINYTNCLLVLQCNNTKLKCTIWKKVLGCLYSTPTGTAQPWKLMPWSSQRSVCADINARGAVRVSSSSATFTYYAMVAIVACYYNTTLSFSEHFRMTHCFQNVCKGRLHIYMLFILYTCSNGSENTWSVAQYFFHIMQSDLIK